MQIILTGVLIWLGTLFLYTGSVKLLRYRQTISSIGQLNIVPNSFTSVAGYLLPPVELLTGIALFYGPIQPLGIALVTSLGLSFALGSALILRRKADAPPCGCTANESDKVSFMTLGRAGAIASSGILLTGITGVAAPQLATETIVGVAAIALTPALIDVIKRFTSKTRHLHASRSAVALLSDG